MLFKTEIRDSRRKMAEEYDGKTTFSLTNSSKEHFNAEQTSQNNFCRLATDSAGRVFPGVWKPLFLKFPSQDGLPFPGRSSLPTSFVSFSSFIFFPTCFWRQWSAFLVAWCAYRSCFVKFARRWNVLLRNLWGRKWSSRPIPLPSFPLP